jgi:nucleoside-diphosphate-sugar epimerase
MKTALVLGGAGFIGMALTRRLKEEGYWVAAADIRRPPFEPSAADYFAGLDLRWLDDVMRMTAPNGQPFDEVYQLACNMGGAGYIFTGHHDAEVIRDNVLINARVAEAFSRIGCGRLLYTSSSCVYDDEMGSNAYRARATVKIGFDLWTVPICEEDAYPANPSNAYGWEKLFSEQLYAAYKRNHGLNVCVTRFSTIYGPGSAFDDGREKAVAAICRKVLDAPNGGEVEVWGDGNQIRPLVYIDDLLEAMTALVRSNDFSGPVNIATQELTTCNDIAEKAIALSNKRLTIKNVPGPIGKQTLHMTTDLAEKHLGWKASTPFDVGLERTFNWIARQKHRRAA